MNFSMILEVVKSIVKPFFDKLNLSQFLVPIILAIAGLVVIFLARRMTRVFKRKNDIGDEDKFMLGLKFFGFAIFFVAVLIIVVQSI